MFNFEEELKKLPDSPGVYIMKDIRGKVIYVGKAVNLKNRVRSYFRGSHIIRTEKMISQIDRFEYIVTDSEYEALLLECTLIKKYKPKYNVLLKDDKNFPYIKVTTEELFPRVMTVRKAGKDGNKYFGPYLGTGVTEGIIDAARKVFPMRLCRKNITSEGGNDRVCLNYHIGLCPGPCGGKISAEEYSENVKGVLELLSGKTDRILDILEEKMLSAAEKEEFEEAAKFRERIKAVKGINDRQKVIKSGSSDCDIIAVYSNERNSCLQIFFFRNGMISGRDYFIVEDTQGVPEQEITVSFIQQFYTEDRLVPPSVYVRCELSEGEYDLLSDYLSEGREHRSKVSTPQKGDKKRLADMVFNNASITLENFELSGKQGRKDRTKILERLGEILSLNKMPSRIEAYDISNLGDSEIDSSMVVFTEGEPDRKGYRHFKIKTQTGRNDVGSMKETVARRMAHLRSEDEDFGGMPDLLLIDGGRGQVEAAKEAVSEAGYDIPVCGMVKDDHHRTRGLYYKGREYRLKDDPDMWHFISSIQDEAHRFAITYNRKLTGRRYMESELDNIPGIGEARRMALYRAMGSLPAIKAATREELAGVKGISKAMADRIYEGLHKEET